MLIMKMNSGYITRGGLFSQKPHVRRNQNSELETRDLFLNGLVRHKSHIDGVHSVKLVQRYLNYESYENVLADQQLKEHSNKIIFDFLSYPIARL